MSILITFAGRIASGKSTLSRQTAITLGWKWASFGDYVRSQAEKQGLDATSRIVLQQVSDSLINAGWTSLCHNVLRQAQWTSGDNLVLDGIRHIEVLNALKEIASPQVVIMVFVDTPDIIREKRLSDRGVSSVDQFAEEQHNSEMQARTILIDNADIVVDGTMPMDDMMDVVLKLIYRYNQHKT